MAMSRLYQLVAVGQDFLGSSARRFSKRVFRTEAAASAYQEEWMTVLTTPLRDLDLGVLDSVTSIRIIELELED